MSDAATITLPGPPVAYAVEPARLVAWLGSHGWEHDPIFGDASGQWYTRGCHTVWLPTCDVGPSYPRDLARSVQTFANLERVEPATLAALLTAPAAGPALQWAHASADTRAPVLALLDREARWERSDATRCRNNDEPELALAAEGRAMAHEAAAAVLRGGGR